MLMSGLMKNKDAEMQSSQFPYKMLNMNTLFFPYWKNQTVSQRDIK